MDNQPQKTPQFEMERQIRELDRFLDKGAEELARNRAASSEEGVTA